MAKPYRSPHRTSHAGASGFATSVLMPPPFCYRTSHAGASGFRHARLQERANRHRTSHAGASGFDRNRVIRAGDCDVTMMHAGLGLAAEKPVPYTGLPPAFRP